MSDNSTIKIEGMDELLDKLKSLEDMRQFIAAMKAGAEHIKGTVDVYPPDIVPREPMSPFWTDKQRRYFFAALKEGKIEVPYRRGTSPGSQMLNKKWTIGEENGGLTQIVGNNVTYGPFLMDETSQTPYMKRRGWKTIQTVVKEQTDRVVKFISDKLNEIINRK